MIQTPARGLCVVLSHLELAVVHVMLQDFQSHFSLSFICFTDNLLSMCFHDASFLLLPVIISLERSLTLEQIYFFAIQFSVLCFSPLQGMRKIICCNSFSSI